MDPYDIRLCLVTDERIPWPTCLSNIQQAVKGGVTLVQLRVKEAPPDEVRRQARQLQSCLAGSGVALVINDHLALAHEVGVDGVHLGQGDASPTEARALLGPSALIGWSVGSGSAFERLAARDLEACSYISASPVFSTASKHDAGPPLGLEGVRTLRKLWRGCLMAIGGIGVSEAEQLAALGIDGIAVVSAIMSDPRPQVAAQALWEAMHR